MLGAFSDAKKPALGGLKMERVRLANGSSTRSPQAFDLAVHLQCTSFTVPTGSATGFPSVQPFALAENRADRIDWFTRPCTIKSFYDSHFSS
jgi:hypothetical protein